MLRPDRPGTFSKYARLIALAVLAWVLAVPPVTPATASPVPLVGGSATAGTSLAGQGRAQVLYSSAKRAKGIKVRVHTNAPKVRFTYRVSGLRNTRTVRARKRTAKVSLPSSASQITARGFGAKGLRPSRTTRIDLDGSRRTTRIGSGTTTIALGGGARLIVPPGAMKPGSKVVVTEGVDPNATWRVTRPTGPAYHLRAVPSDAIRGLLTLEMPVESWQVQGDPSSAMISTLAEGSKTWQPVETTYDAGRGVLIAHIDHFSWWNPSTWDWDKIILRFNQDIGEILGKRAQPPSCRGSAPSWVAGTAGIQTDAAVAVRACTQSDGDLLDVQIVNNRPYGMVLKYGAPVKWSWHEEGGSQIDKDRNRMMDALTADDELYLPPLGHASLGIYALSPGTNATFKISITGKSLAGDIAGMIFGDILSGPTPDFSECASWINGISLGDGSPGALRDAILSSGDCLMSSYKAMLGDTASTKKVNKTLQALRTAKAVGKYFAIAGVTWKLADIFADTVLVGSNSGPMGAGFLVRAKAQDTGGGQPPAPQPPAPPPSPPSGPAGATIVVNTCNTYNNCDYWNPIWVHSNPAVSSRIADVSRGTSLTARCWAIGRRLTDGSDNTTEDDARQFTSSLWYGIDWNGGRGYVPAVWTTKREDHLGLPGC